MKIIHLNNEFFFSEDGQMSNICLLTNHDLITLVSSKIVCFGTGTFMIVEYEETYSHNHNYLVKKK